MQIITVIILTFVGLLEIKRLPLCLDSAMSMISIMYVGYLLKKFKDEKWIQKVETIPWWCWMLICICGGTIIMINAGVNIRCNHYANIWLFLIGCLLTLFGYFGLARWLDKIQCKAIQFIMGILKYFGRNSIVFLVLNELVIHAAYLVMHYCGIFNLDDVFTIKNFLVKLCQLVFTMLGLALATEFFNRTIFKVIIGKQIKGFQVLQ